ncbi:hypothetical protein GGF49_000409 [Coemansia sp. RSA 1853]|nr:hypothetical protein LPJ76_002646 [Coemansia sp. RSA 638]KAJ2545376.1 hypothetical protein GGF49_000409 [Coemansia sp. RSA 1853]
MNADSTPDASNQQPLATSVADQGIARLLQTVKDADALVSDEQSANANTTATITHSSTEVVMDDANVKPSDSASSSDSDSDSEFNADSDDDMDGGQRSLLQIMEDGDDDDAQPSSAVVKSRNEILEPEIPALPTTQLPDTVQLCPLGTVHSAVDRSVIIQANISGEVHVLDSESLVVFEDRSVLGMIFDVFGPVARPMYTVRFNKSEDIDSSRCTIGRPVFYALGWARMLSTDRLRIKGTDASNEYDEEVGDEAMDFSDDEAEVAFKRQKKKEQALKPRFREPRAPPATRQDPAASSSGTGQPDATTAPSVAGRKLQSYEDICEDFGF